MPRPRTSIGTFGEINITKAGNGRFCALARFRDHDGRLRRVQATATSPKAAKRKLKELLAGRTVLAVGGPELTPSSSFGHLVDLWLADLDIEGKLAESTLDLYERNMRRLVLPTFEHLTLREISVGRVDRFLKSLVSSKSYSTAKQARTVLNLAFGLAVRYDALPTNPVRETARLHKPPSQALALTVEQVDAIREAVHAWRTGPGVVGPPPDGQLEQIIEVMLGTSARIGEVLAIRKRDVDVTVSPATVRICGTIVSPKGRPTHRQPHPKTKSSTRVLAVPRFTADVLRTRLAVISDESPDHLLFFSRNHTPLTTNNVRRRLRTVLQLAGITGVTPHAFRRTVATVLDRASGADLAAQMLGHTSPKITREHYIEPDEKVNPVTAEILESLAPRRKIK
jgi:integrase